MKGDDFMSQKQFVKNEDLNRKMIQEITSAVESGDADDVLCTAEAIHAFVGWEEDYDLSTLINELHSYTDEIDSLIGDLAEELDNANGNLISDNITNLLGEALCQLGRLSFSPLGIICEDFVNNHITYDEFFEKFAKVTRAKLLLEGLDCFSGLTR